MSGGPGERWLATYHLYSDMDPSGPYAEGSVVVAVPVGATAREVTDAAISAVVDTDPYCDDRVHPMVRVTHTEPTDEEPSRARSVCF